MCVADRDAIPEGVAMLSVGPNHLPRVNVVPRVVAPAAVGRGLQRLYADVLQQPMPDDVTALLRRLDVEVT